MCACRCIHLTRELVIDDGFARMSKQEIAEALHLYLARLTEANDAVRLGGSLGIKVGADKRNARHNRIMYGVSRSPTAISRQTRALASAEPQRQQACCG